MKAIFPGSSSILLLVMVPGPENDVTIMNYSGQSIVITARSSSIPTTFDIVRLFGPRPRCMRPP